MKTRRAFLQNITMASAGLPFLTINASSLGNIYKSDDKVLRVALLGLGGYAQRVAESIQSCKRVKITGLISGTPDKLKTWSAKYNVPEKSCYNYQNFDSIKDNPEVDAVYVITPNSLHREFTIRAAKAGKHVICEKPMAINVKEGEEMIAACKKANVKLLIGYRMHFEPHTLEVIRMRNEGDFGQIKFFQGLCGFRIGDPAQWRLSKALAGGGSLMDIGIYAINGCRYMVGEEPIWVTAQETKTDPVKFKEGVDETIQFQFGFKSGAVASCLSTYNMNNLDRFFLNGEKGFAEMLPSTGYGPIKGKTNKGEINAPVVVHQTEQMDQMAGILFDGKKPVVPVDGEEGLKDLKIIEAIYKAVATGKKVSL
ncbi:Gfo/Idh/MocA family protein [Niabella ginsengisoli]|uniref:Gfo/Idh/MocA family oxidoreductase n=1 Tax=Niabella ginsengisoli TaxID=522298 RepID=A0ABS9SH63_9BACT|nr:Gfo/Idh/MocA family oxidoreductase [Niabella ginsengisoli]MCH5597675.1 Gfo/Idh/MocA family oxidoreductase [Niabella ginsengisoli]